MKKLIYYKWGSNSDDVLVSFLKNAGYEPVIIDRPCVSYTRDMDLAGEFISKINETGASFVFSYDYFPILSIVCDTCKIPYYSWVYDSPHLTLYAGCIGYECNHIGVFDRFLVKKFESMGIKTLFHLPLGADPAYFERSVKACADDYSCDVSFVGSLYTDKHEYYSLIKTEYCRRDAEIWEGMDDLVLSQAFDNEKDHISEMLENVPDLAGYLYGLLEEKGLALGKDYISDKKGIVRDAVLSRRVTVLERKEILEAMAGLSKEKGYDFRLYTASEPEKGSILSDSVFLKGTVDYKTQMPAVFAKSRINLNITLRSIRTGIPLRAVDILSSGGFLLTDPREEFFEYLTEGEDFEVFRSPEECAEKVKYYLEHEEKRKEIAAKGRGKAEKCFNLQRLTDILPSS